MAPEYAMHGYLSVKADVFSFGILVLEIVSGRKVTERQLGAEKSDLLTYVSHLINMLTTAHKLTIQKRKIVTLKVTNMLFLSAKWIHSVLG